MRRCLGRRRTEARNSTVVSLATFGMSVGSEPLPFRSTASETAAIALQTRPVVPTRAVEGPVRTRRRPVRGPVLDVLRVYVLSRLVVFAGGRIRGGHAARPGCRPVAGGLGPERGGPPFPEPVGRRVVSPAVARSLTYRGLPLDRGRVPAFVRAGAAAPQPRPGGRSPQLARNASGTR
jgi:hypothetical protein